MPMSVKNKLINGDGFEIIIKIAPFLVVKYS